MNDFGRLLAKGNPAAEALCPRIDPRRATGRRPRPGHSRPRDRQTASLAMPERHSPRAEERDLEERLRYHEASRKDAEELLALYQRRWPKEAAVGRLEYVEAKPAKAI
jgi:hypothetical protein